MYSKIWSERNEERRAVTISKSKKKKKKTILKEDMFWEQIHELSLSHSQCPDTMCPTG